MHGCSGCALHAPGADAGAGLRGAPTGPRACSLGSPHTEFPSPACAERRFFVHNTETAPPCPPDEGLCGRNLPQLSSAPRSGSLSTSTAGTRVKLLLHAGHGLTPRADPTRGPQATDWPRRSAPNGRLAAPAGRAGSSTALRSSEHLLWVPRNGPSSRQPTAQQDQRPQRQPRARISSCNRAG